MWASFLTSIDIVTLSDAHWDLIFEALMRLRERDRFRFLEQFNAFHPNKEPKNWEEIWMEIRRFK